VFQHPQAVDRAFFLGDGRIVTLARDKIVREMRIDQTAMRALPDVGKATALTVSVRSARVAVGFEDGGIRVAYGNPLQWATVLKILSEPVSKLQFPGNLILAASEIHAAVTDLNDLSKNHVYPAARAS
jgi:hypothetical protein